MAEPITTGLTPDGWHTLESAREQWTDAPYVDSTLSDLLETARIQCEAFAPAVTGPVAPVNYRQAQLLQVRNLWQATTKNVGGDIDAGGFSMPVYPLDWIVKGLLRPKRGVPIVG